ncbi:iron-sulfur cluster assembly scaffold protein [Candidatus Peregrinibacteria bacterium]|nr:MAG: iron-sulfur cluster assembly scaffold protein [Candidatus Peregrinibacteria bacterium]
MDLYAEQIIDLAKNPLNRGEMEAATLTSSGVNTTCGDHVRLYLKMEDRKVMDASWEGDGCAISIATASVLTEEIKGKKWTDSKELTKQDLYEWLGIDNLGPARVKCLTLSLETLHNALIDL